MEQENTSAFAQHLRTMIRNLIFDLGAVLLDIDLDAFKVELARIRDDYHFSFNHEELGFYKNYESGVITTDAFFKRLSSQFSGPVEEERLRAAWALILKEPIPESMAFLKSMQGKYNIYLLSNTNEAHRLQFDEIFNKILGEGVFYELFDAAYYSYEMGEIKPSAAIYQRLLIESELKAKECFFIDDNEMNIASARKLGIEGWCFKGVADWGSIREKIKGGSV